MCHACRAQTLELQVNRIGDAGVTALANACAGGALASGAMVLLAVNKATKAGKQAVRDAAKARGVKVHF